MVPIAHRLEKVPKAHQILMVKDGEVMESGKYDELKKKNGVCHRL